MNELPEFTQVPAGLAEQIKFARDWWHDDPVCLLPGEEGGHTVFVIEFYDGCKYFGYTRKSVVARVASLMSESGGWGSNAFVREHGGSVPYVVRCVASNLDQRQGRQLRDLLVARAPGDVYVAYGTTAITSDCWLSEGDTEEAEVMSFSEWIKTRETQADTEVSEYEFP